MSDSVASQRRQAVVCDQALERVGAMAAASQFLFTRKELIELMIKGAGVHEGRWMLDANFRTTGGNFGPPEDPNPGVNVVIQSLGIQLVSPGSDLPASMIVDAAVVNPGATTTAEPDGKKRSSRGLN